MRKMGDGPFLKPLRPILDQNLHLHRTTLGGCFARRTWAKKLGLALDLAKICN